MDWEEGDQVIETQAESQNSGQDIGDGALKRTKAQHKKERRATEPQDAELSQLGEKSWV